jgi:curli biogenesis system outer membrane secretion channel CsgG
MKPLLLSLAIGGIVVLLIGGCSGSKSFSKKGEKLDASGLYAEAADMYLQGLMRNTRNVDAKIGLKKTGQMLLNDKLSGFFKEFSMGDNKEAAVNAFLGARAYADRVGQYGVVLDIPGNYQSDFNEVKGKYLVDLYTQGQDLMAKQDFKGAESIFAKIGALEPGYKDAGSLQNVAYLEPLYRSGKEALAENHFRKAYDELGKVVAKDATYKDASTLRNEAVDKGKYSIAALPFGGTVKEKAQAARLNAYVISSITEINDPFIKVVDRENIQRILDEQRLGMSGVVDEATAVSAGKLLGAQAVLMGSLIDFREENGQLKRSTKDGFASYQVKQPDPNNPGQSMVVTKYKPVKYTEYFQENKVFLSFSYKLVSLETGEVLMSKVVDQEKADHAYYATYDGDGNTLYPARNGVVETANNARRELVGLLNASKEVKPTGSIANDLCRQATAGMASAIREELAAKLQ